MLGGGTRLVMAPRSDSLKLLNLSKQNSVGESVPIGRLGGSTYMYIRFWVVFHRSGLCSTVTARLASYISSGPKGLNVNASRQRDVSRGAVLKNGGKHFHARRQEFERHLQLVLFAFTKKPLEQTDLFMQTLAFSNLELHEKRQTDYCLSSDCLASCWCFK